MMRIILLIAAVLFASASSALTPKDIYDKNAPAVIYLEKRSNDDSRSGAVDRGSGLIVSHDGFLLTAAHLNPGANEFLQAIVGERQGVSYKLTFVDMDSQSDISLWKLPQSLACRRTVAIGSKAVKVLDRLLVLGFPGSSGLTPTSVVVANTSGPKGFFETDGNIDEGDSGAPAFNEQGGVVGLVHGGRSVGTRSNNLVPIAPAVDLLRKHSVDFSMDEPKPLPIDCYAACRAEENGIESWGSVNAWRKESGWLGGGNNQGDICNSLKVADLGNQKNISIEITRTWEESKKDILGHVEYKYFCEGTIRSNPIYKEARAKSCGLWFQ